MLRTADAIENAEGVFRSTCANGHDLYVTQWTKKNATGNCGKCKGEINYREQVVTCADRNCFVSECMKCSGCMHGHVAHRRTVKEDLPAKHDSCLRCLKDIRKQTSIKWCGECNGAFCPDSCQIRRIE